MFQVQHFVKEDVLDRIARDARIIEEAADDDRVMSGVVVAQTVAGLVAAPRKSWTPHEAVKEAAVQVFENLFKVILPPASRVDVFASAHLANEPRLGRHVVTKNVSAIARTQSSINRLAIQLAEQDVGDPVQDRFGRAFKQIRDAKVKFALTETDRVVDRDERIETNMNRGKSSVRPEIAVGACDDFLQVGRHSEED